MFSCDIEFCLSYVLGSRYDSQKIRNSEDQSYHEVAHYPITGCRGQISVRCM